MEEINCFKCTKPLDVKGAILLSSPEEFFSDNVDKVSKFHICKNCEKIIMSFILGEINHIQVQPKLHLILSIIERHEEGDWRKLTLINEMVTDLLQEIHQGVPT